MKIQLLFVFIIIALAVLVVFNFDYATSVIPGWHTTIYPPFFVAGFFFWWFLLVTLAYKVFFRKAFTRKNVIFYLALTFPLILLVQFLRLADGYVGEWQISLTVLMPVFLIFVVAYFVAQVWFLVKVGMIGVRQSKDKL